MRELHKQQQQLLAFGLKSSYHRHGTAFLILCVLCPYTSTTLIELELLTYTTTKKNPLS